MQEGMSMSTPFSSDRFTHSLSRVMQRLIDLGYRAVDVRQSEIYSNPRVRTESKLSTQGEPSPHPSRERLITF